MSTANENKNPEGSANEKLVNPKCPNCGNEEFVYRRVPEEKDRVIVNKRRRKLKVRPGIFHVALVYCVTCGEIIGTSGGYYA